MKSLIRLFLSLCFLVLSGYGYLYTHTYRDNMSLTVKPAQSGAEKKHDRLKATEVEDDDDLVSSRPRIYAGNSLSISFHTQSAMYARAGYDIALPVYNESPGIPARRYIIYRVIRI